MNCFKPLHQSHRNRTVQYTRDCTKCWRFFFGIMCPSRSSFFDCEDSTGIKIFSKFGFFTVDFNTFNFVIRNHILNYNRKYKNQECEIIFDNFLEFVWFPISRLKVLT